MIWKTDFRAPPPNWTAIDAVIIGSLEAAALSTEQHEWLRDFVDRRGGCLLLLAGRDGMGDGGWGRVPVGALLPACCRAARHQLWRARSQVRLTTYGAESPVGPSWMPTQRRMLRMGHAAGAGRFPDRWVALRPGAIVLLEARGRASAPTRCW